MIKTWQWKKTMQLILAASAVSGGLLWTQVGNAEVPRRQLELELEEVDGGTGYEIRVTRILTNGTRKPPVMFKTKTRYWSAKLLPGRYAISSRSLDKRKVAGEWGKEEVIDVKFPALEPSEPQKDATINAEERQNQKVGFSWKGITGAETYTVTITDAENKSQTVTTKNTSTEVDLPVAQKYTWSVAANFQGQAGDSSEPRSFMLIGPELETPSIGTIVDINTTRIEWSAPEFHKEYEFVLERETKSGWKQVQKKRLPRNYMSYKKPLATGRYRVLVQAFGDNRKPSEPAEEIFSTDRSNRSPAAIEQMRSEGAYDTRKRFFAFASYNATLLTYESNIQNSSGPNSMKNALAGTGRLGGGFWFKEGGSVGLLTSLEYSGFLGTIEQDESSADSTEKTQNFTYYSATAQGIYRYRLGAIGQLRLSGGLLYRNIPVVSKPVGRNEFQTSEMTTLGPIVEAALSRGLTRTIGIQTRVGLYYSALGMSMPEGGTNVSKLSYQFSLLGSSQLVESLVGFAGFSYKKDSGAYTTNGASQENTVDMTGMYLNFTLEYGF